MAKAEVPPWKGKHQGQVLDSRLAYASSLVCQAKHHGLDQRVVNGPARGSGVS